MTKNKILSIILCAIFISIILPSIQADVQNKNSDIIKDSAEEITRAVPVLLIGRIRNLEINKDIVSFYAIRVCQLSRFKEFNCILSGYTEFKDNNIGGIIRNRFILGHGVICPGGW